MKTILGTLAIIFASITTANADTEAHCFKADELEIEADTLEVDAAKLENELPRIKSESEQSLLKARISYDKYEIWTSGSISQKTISSLLNSTDTDKRAAGNEMIRHIASHLENAKEFAGKAKALEAEYERTKIEAERLKAETDRLRRQAEAHQRKCQGE